MSGGRFLFGVGSGGYRGVIWFDQMRTLLYADDFLLESARDWIVLSAVAVMDAQLA